VAAEVVDRYEIVMATKVIDYCSAMQQSADKGQTAHGSDLHPFCVMYGAEVWDTTKAVKDKMSAVKESSPQHSSPASRRSLF
jgi:hypothetical protein